MATNKSTRKGKRRTTKTNGQRTHILKCWPEHFHEIVSGRKTFEIRKNDRGFAPTDILHLKEFCPDANDETGLYTNREFFVEVTHIIRGGQLGIEKGSVLLSIKTI